MTSAQFLYCYLKLICYAMKLFLTNADNVLGKCILRSLEKILTAEDTLVIISDAPYNLSFQRRTLYTHVIKPGVFADADVIINTVAEYTPQILSMIEPKTFLIDAMHTIKSHANAQLVDLSNINTLTTLPELKKILILSHIATLGACTVLKTILSHCSFDFIAINTCQAISDAGIQAMKALDRERKHEELHIHDNPQFFDNYIYSNLIPGIGTIDEHLNTSDENQVVGEVKRLLDHDVNVAVTCIHVPIKIGHVISVQMHASKELQQSDIHSIQQLLQKNDQIIFIEKPVKITPKDSIGYEKILVSRLRMTDSGISFIITYDNLVLQAKTIEILLNILRTR